MFSGFHKNYVYLSMSWLGFENMNCDTLKCIRRFLPNRDLIETLCVSRWWMVAPGQSIFTELRVSQHDDLMTMIRRYLHHRQTICQTVLIGMDLSEWPFQSAEMMLVSCRGNMVNIGFGITPPRIRTFRYQHQYEQFVQKDQFDRYVESLRNMERLSITSESNQELM